MTIHETKFLDWHSIFAFSPVLEGSTNQILKVMGTKSGEVRRLTSELTQLGSDGRLNLSINPSAPWITSTSSLAEQNPALDKAEGDDLKIRDSIWQTLTMGLLPPKMTAKAAASCFSTLWRPEGRGAVHNLALIEWIDQNAWLSYGNWTLREWSQMKALSPAVSTSSTVKSWKFLRSSQNKIQSQRVPETQNTEHTVEQLVAFIDSIECVLKSGMRLAVISGYGASDEEYIGMVHPSARTSDQVWYIRGCSVPIVLREIEGFDGQNKYEVIGAMYLYDAKKRFGREEKWIRDKRGGGANVLVHDPEVLNLC
ncbi:hypothetical protein N431DRAFT_425717 [Stipitochalara longipes BDJ]|nr:hypothetical protein N431DRAFT_425717 [Stipitochalara longipes BDJ]